MTNNDLFIGRTSEIGLLRSLIQKKSPAMGVVYGRRRVGKTALVKKAFAGEKVLTFEGLENRPKREQMSNFIFQLTYQTNTEKPAMLVTSWREAFVLLYETIKNNPHHLFFDEFQWMASYRHEIVSELKMVWDQYISKCGPVTLILCGSIASFMIEKVIKSHALYGRADLQLHLKPFSLNETNLLLKPRGFTEVLEAHLYTSGIPKYLEIIKGKPSIRLGIEQEAFTSGGYFFSEYERIFTSHFGKNPDYEKIIRILAQHQYGLFRSEIPAAAGVKAGGMLTEQLENLETAGFISSATPFQKGPNSKLIKYFLVDSFLRLYFSFILPHKKQIIAGAPGDIFTAISQTGLFFSWMGKSFEYCCIQHARKISEILGFPGIDFTFGPYFKPKHNIHRGIQIDLLFSRADNVLTLCEMKYSRDTIGTSIIDETEKKASLLQQDFPSKTVQRVLITQSKPSRDLAASGYFYRIIDATELI
ncbi:MAG: AAA family ATPase [Chitinivibrionales bacterium]|nr:AAA family ATPase [Chitinivibrionales bacterium]